MGSTVNIKVSDAIIKRYAGDPSVTELKDPRHPLRFRYRNDRSRGSWHVVQYSNGGKWKKAGNWPEVSATMMLGKLPDVQARLLVDPRATASVGNWATVGQVLTWYSERAAKDRNLSTERKGSIRSAIKCQLAPRLADLALTELNKSTLDDRLFRPMQADYSLSYVRSCVAILKGAFVTAKALDWIPSDLLDGVTFGNFSKAKVRPKGARLRHVSVVDLLVSWADAYKDRAQDIAFAVMMLCHGTRISETRKAKWKNIHLSAGEWFIPAADTKSRRDHLLPLTAQATAFLNRYRDSQAAQGYTGAFLFPSASRSGQAISRSQAFAIFNRLGEGEWTSHDLRKLAPSIWANLGVDSLVGKLLLNHSLTELERTYFQALGEDVKRNALERWHGWLDVQGFDALQDKTAARRTVKPIPVDPSGWLG